MGWNYTCYNCNNHDAHHWTWNARWVSLACQGSWMPYATLTSDGEIPSGIEVLQLALQAPLSLSPLPTLPLCYKKGSCRNEVRLQEYWMTESETRNGAGSSRDCLIIWLPKSKIVTNQVLLYLSLGSKIPLCVLPTTNGVMSQRCASLLKSSWKTSYLSQECFLLQRPWAQLAIFGLFWPPLISWPCSGTRCWSASNHTRPTKQQSSHTSAALGSLC